MAENADRAGTGVDQRTDDADRGRFGGGAIYNLGTLTISRSTLSSNKAEHDGGALLNGTATIVNSTLWGNEAGHVELISDEYDPGWGGAIHNKGALIILSSTLANNKGGRSYDPDSEAGSANLCNNLGTATVKNTILASAPFEYCLYINPIQCLPFDYLNQSCSGTSLVATNLLSTYSSCGTSPVPDAKLVN